MFNPDYRVSTQMCCLRDVFMRMFAHYKTSVRTLIDLRRHVYVYHLTYNTIFFI